MASKLSGKGFDVLTSDFETKRLLSAAAFGTSMCPFIKSGAELQLEDCALASIRVGDVLMFRTSSGVSITHRVVTISGSGDERSFILKGDNRVSCDPPVLESQIIGRVSHINGVFVRSAVYRWMGRIIAFLTYGQSVLCKFLSESSLNLLRRQMEKKGLCPRVALRVPFGKAVNLLIWLAFFQFKFEQLRISNLRTQLSKQGVLFEAGLGTDREAVAQLWNKSFPEHATNLERLNRLVFHGARFNGTVFFLAKQNTNLLGWGSVYLESQNPRTKWPVETGSIDAFMLTEEGWRIGLDGVFFKEMIGWLRARHARQILLNPQPVSDHFSGFKTNSLMLSASKFGFEPMSLLEELVVTRETFREPQQKLPPNIIIRPYESKDESQVREFLAKAAWFDAEHFLDNLSKSNILIAALKQKIVGYCRWIQEKDITDCGEAEWLWVAAVPEQPRGYVSRLLIDESFRNCGIGTALAARAFKELFNTGCQDIALMVLKDRMNVQNFYSRFGFEKAGTFLKMRCS